MALLAGDVGGTKTLLGLFERGRTRPRRLAVHTYATASFGSFGEILDAFARDIGVSIAVEAAAVGAAGPGIDNRARLTNIDWDVSASDIAARFGTSHVYLMNDLEAIANSADVLTPDEALPLQDRRPHPDGNAVVIAAGTGLGQAFLHRIGGRLRPLASEGGHADFAPRTDREIELLRMLRADFGRAEVEQVLSGSGLVNLHRFTHDGRPCATLRDAAPDARAAAISQSALAAECDACVEALDVFVSVYGAEAGNLALRGVATAGVYVAGGIAPKILPALQNGRFMEAFRAKGTMTELVERMPVKVILNPETGLLGAALYAQEFLPA